jgi:hypothetical protein
MITTNKTDIGTFVTSLNFIELNKVYEEYLDKYGEGLVSSINPIYSEGVVKYQFQVLASFGLEPPAIEDFNVERMTLTNYKVTLFINEDYIKELAKPMNDLSLAMGETQMSYCNNLGYTEVDFSANGEAVLDTINKLVEYNLMSMDLFKLFIKYYDEEKEKAIDISTHPAQHKTKKWCVLGAEFHLDHFLNSFVESLGNDTLKFDGVTSLYKEYRLLLNIAEYNYLLSQLNDNYEANINIRTHALV